VLDIEEEVCSFSYHTHLSSTIFHAYLPASFIFKKEILNEMKKITTINFQWLGIKWMAHVARSDG